MKVPDPFDRASFAGLVDPLFGLVGAPLRGVKYHYLPVYPNLPVEDETTIDAGAERGFDYMISAVVLDLGERGRRTITWSMRGDLQGLAVLGSDTTYEGVQDGTLDAGARDAWQRFDGELVVAVAAAWHVPDETGVERVLSLRLVFAEGAIVIALGEDFHELRYAPDELVVIHDPAIAQAYGAGDFGGSSLGRTHGPVASHAPPERSIIQRSITVIMTSRLDIAEICTRCLGFGRARLLADAVFELLPAMAALEHSRVRACRPR